MKIQILALSAAMLIGATSANAVIIVDQSPDAIGLVPDVTAQNIAQGQNFLFKFAVGASTLTGVDIYTDCNALGCGPITLGQAVVVKLTGDLGGSPDFGSLVSFNTTLSAIDSLLSTANPRVQRFHADFSQAVAAGTYWIGLSGDNSEIGLSLQTAPTGQGLWILSGDAGAGDLGGSYTGSFNVYGGTVPEPASWALMIAGFGMVGAAMRRRKAALAA